MRPTLHISPQQDKIISRMRPLLESYGFDFVVEVFTAFKNQGVKNLTTLDPQDPKSVSYLAHSFRASAKNFGLEEFSDLCRDLDENADTMTPDELASKSGQMRSDFEGSCDFLEDLFHRF